MILKPRHTSTKDLYGKNILHFVKKYQGLHKLVSDMKFLPFIYHSDSRHQVIPDLSAPFLSFATIKQCHVKVLDIQGEIPLRIPSNIEASVALEKGGRNRENTA